jgi:hypothetical protein
MATSTLVQFLNPGVSSATMNRSQEETFLAGGIIALGDWVAFDLSKTGADKALYVVQAPNVAASGIITGVAVQAAAAGEQVRVCVDGYVASANVATGTGAGAALQCSGTAGRAESASYIGDGSGAAAIPLPAICGVALTAAAGNTAEVMVKKQF